MIALALHLACLAYLLLVLIAIRPANERPALAILRVLPLLLAAILATELYLEVRL